MEKIRTRIVTGWITYCAAMLILYSLPSKIVAQNKAYPPQPQPDESPQLSSSSNLILEPNNLTSETNTKVSEPNQSTSKSKTHSFERFITVDTDDSLAEWTSEIVGFVVRGRHSWERLVIEDMDSIVNSEGRRLLPLLRILRAFKVKITDEGKTITFTPEGVGQVTLDLDKKEIQINEESRALYYREARSEITMKADIYIPPEDLSKIMDMELEWDSALYEYRIQLDRSLSIWPAPQLQSLYRIRTDLISPDLPEILPLAQRSNSMLYWIQTDLKPSYSWTPSSQSESEHAIGSGSPTETVWGAFRNGRYKLRISHPQLSWQDSSCRNNNDDYIAELGQFEWVYRLPSAEVAFGDSSFGLSELAFPASQLSGLRINGLSGFSELELDSDRSSLGLRRVFNKPYVFEGSAPLGAQVELLLNDRTIAVQQVSQEESSALGFGTYRFEDVELPNGILNHVVFVITEENGNQIRVEKSIIGTPLLLPKGRSAYLGVLGSSRERARSDRQNLEFGDFFGQMVGGRLLYGLTEHMTIGTIFALEKNLYEYYQNWSFSTARNYPQSSEHIGAEFTYLPFDKLLVSGTVAASSGDGADNYDGFALLTKTEYLPTEKIRLNLDIFNIGPSYFNGENPNISDQLGGEFGLSWKVGKKWSLESNAGYTRDNLDDSLLQTSRLDYQSIGLNTTMMPRTSLGFNFGRLGFNLDEKPKTFGAIQLRSSLIQNWDISGNVSVGEEMYSGTNPDFWSGLRLRNAPLFVRPSQDLTIRRRFNADSSIGVRYNDMGMQKSVSLLHYWQLRLKEHPLRMSTEIRHNLESPNDEDEFAIRSNIDYLLDSLGYNRLRITTNYSRGEFRLIAQLSIRNLFSHFNRRLINVNKQRIITAYGAVHGKVFLDYNNNHRPDSGEPGVPDIRVGINGIKSTLTDKNGYYILSGISNGPNARVHIDVDTVPAIYTITHGTQLASIVKDSLTEVNLSLAPMISLIGRVTAKEQEDKTKPISGIKIYLKNPQSGRLVADSITANDGIYYIDDVRPGKYILQIDTETLPANYELSEQDRTIEIVSTKEDFQEIELEDFIVRIKQEQD